MAASILHTRVNEVEGGNLDVGILVAYPLLQASHRLFGLDLFGPDRVADL